MLDNILRHNALGTAYNVLLEQGHPDIEQLAELLRENLSEINAQQQADNNFVNVGQFDLRYRRFDGTNL
jgi:hypothetical protein